MVMNDLEHRTTLQQPGLESGCFVCMGCGGREWWGRVEVGWGCY